MKTAIINKKERLIIVGGMNLLPGANYVDNFLVKKHKEMLEEKAESGCIEMPKLEVEDDLDTSLLGGFNAGDSIKLVKETNDYDLLMKMQIEETAGKARKTVLEAISSQIQISKDALENSGNNE